MPPDLPRLDATARAMRRVAARPKTTTVKQAKRQIRETYVRYKVVVTRVQAAERFVRATSEEDAGGQGAGRIRPAVRLLRVMEDHNL